MTSSNILKYVVLFIILNSFNVLGAYDIISNNNLYDDFKTNDIKDIKDSIFTTLKYNDEKNKEAIFTMDSTKIKEDFNLDISFNEICGKVKSYDILTVSTCYKNEEICNKNNMTNITTCYNNSLNYKCDIPYTKTSNIKDVKITNVQIEESWCLINNTYYKYYIDWMPKLTIGDNILTDTKWAWWKGVGGTITTIIDINDGLNYTVHTYTANGTFNTTGILPTTTVQALVVAGGGGGGGSEASGLAGGGGGAGGLIYNNSYILAAGNYTVIVGSGGVFGGTAQAGFNGTNSSFGNLIARGGGGGAEYIVNGGDANSGGSGGGGASGIGFGALGVTGQGNRGGNGTGDANYSGGGGGGAGGMGVNGTLTFGGNGGIGLNYSINGTNVNYSGGGGGGSITNVGTGGSSIGGNGAFATTNATYPKNNTGGGGGGGVYVAVKSEASSGGSGIVIIRYITVTNSYNSNTTSNGTYLNTSKNWIYVSVNTTILNTTIYLYNSSGLLSSYTSLDYSNITNFNFTLLKPDIYIVNATADNNKLPNIIVNIYGVNINITNPSQNNQIIRTTLNITYNTTIYSNTTGINISYYNISLLNSDLSFNTTIIGNNSINQSYYWSNMSNMVGSFYISIRAIDNLGNNITQISNAINISYNELKIFFYDESNNSVLTANVTITLSSILNNYINTSTTGNMTFINLINNTYTLIASAENYTNKIYEIVIINNEIKIFNITLLSNITSVPITIILKDTLSRVIPDARVIISRAYSGNWVTISDGISDDGGTILTSLQPSITHTVTIISTGFLVKNFVQIFESANSPYTFILTATTGTVYSDIFNDVNISYSPLSSILQKNISYNFSLNVLSTSGLLQWASINSTLNNTNSTGTNVIIQTINVNTSNLNSTYIVKYCVKQSNFEQYCFNINYYIEGRIMNNNSLENSFVKFKDNFTGNDTSWLSIMAIAAILCICIILTEISGGNVTVVTIGGFVGLIFFAFVGWLNIVLVGFLVIIGGVLFFFNKGGQA